MYGFFTFNEVKNVIKRNKEELNDAGGTDKPTRTPLPISVGRGSEKTLSSINNHKHVGDLI